MTDVVEVFHSDSILMEITYPDGYSTLEVTEGTVQIVEVVTPGPQGPQGEVGAQGVQGETGPSPSFEQTFAEPAEQWLIVHDLPGQPEVTTVDFNGSEIVGDVSFPTPTSVLVQFAMPVAGVARLKA